MTDTMEGINVQRQLQRNTTSKGRVASYYQHLQHGHSPRGVTVLCCPVGVGFGSLLAREFNLFTGGVLLSLCS